MIRAAAIAVVLMMLMGSSDVGLAAAQSTVAAQSSQDTAPVTAQDIAKLRQSLEELRTQLAALRRRIDAIEQELNSIQK